MFRFLPLIPPEPLLCLPPNWWVLWQSRHWKHSWRFAGWLYQGALILTSWVTKRGGIPAVMSKTEKWDVPCKKWHKTEYHLLIKKLPPCLRVSPRRPMAGKKKGKHCRVNMDIKVANSQVLDKPWLDFSMDVVPSRRLGHRKRRSVTWRLVAAVFFGMLQAFTGASKTWSTKRDSAGVGCIWVRGPWWNWTYWLDIRYKLIV